ncbi:hypothetical protein HH310_12465 [Actinoplanes sp. TBRC 11911]|uniref:HNH endonuclease n=1 Tax=Actinoplanes sp. TBRC 11911 TaxID=2729386 RepID=UPI00145CFEDF|nr:HNH endonuclease [Actinoplanes sp. TBRC 11911]NMO52007.1 hypothetical protein [Actinoplanes sp. TBRC 11911]
MPYWLESDDFHIWPVWEALADGAADVVDRLQAAYARLKSEASHGRRDGYLMAGAVLRQCRGKQRTVDLLCTAVLGEQPLLHRPGDDCECLGETWIEGYGYRIHAFLKRNPSRRENDRSKQQKADLNDARLKGVVQRRDGKCCRYCRSGPLSAKAVRAKDRRKVLTFDHVDPDRAAGPEGDNLVVACARCNEGKGKRTPYEADMVLLPAPDADEAAAMERREQLLLDPPPPGADHPATNPGSTPDQPINAPITDQNNKPTTDPIGDPITDPPSDPNSDPAPEVRPTPATSPAQSAPAVVPEPSGLGRVGRPGPEPAPAAAPTHQQEPRTSHYPDIYHHRSRLPEPPPDLPPYTWPPGSIPATPPPAREDSP